MVSEEWKKSFLPLKFPIRENLELCYDIEIEKVKNKILVVHV